MGGKETVKLKRKKFFPVSLTLAKFRENRDSEKFTEKNKKNFGTERLEERKDG